MADMLQHIFHPVPDLDDDPSELLDEEQRIEVILANLSKQRDAIRERILQAARVELATASADLSTLSIEDTTSPDVDLVLANLDNKATNHANTGASTTEVETPLAITLAMRTRKQLDDYEVHMSSIREPYIKALGELRARRANGGGEATTANTTAGEAPAEASANDGIEIDGDTSMDDDPTMANAPPATNGVSQLPARTSARSAATAAFSRSGTSTPVDGAVQSPVNGNVDASRDPRRRSSAREGPGEAEVDRGRDPRRRAGV